MARLEVGDRAPAFTLVDQHGEKVKLTDFKGKKVIVYFYPKADTPGCTTQSCELRDHRKELTKLGAEVLGISPDAPAKQAKFDDEVRARLPAPRRRGPRGRGEVRRVGREDELGKKYMGIIRSAFVVDEKGKIAGAFYKVSPKATIASVKSVL